MENSSKPQVKIHKVSAGFVYFFGALGGLLFGYDTGVISGAILFIERQLHLDSWQQAGSLVPYYLARSWELRDWTNV